MEQEKWAKVKEIFHAALEVADEERPQFVAERCGEDAALLDEVCSLLLAHRESPDLFESPARTSVKNFVDNSAANSRVGQVIGAYRIEREIGKGGMGAVYLAARADSEFRKAVAIKLIKRGFDTDEIIRRFRHERQILATLEHPYITRLIDGGATDDGLPYLVMDYVRGVPLNVFADRKGLSVKERLELFSKICSAVAYAHQNLVIHRDLKPSNILVADDGTPRLLDFGIAKLVAAEDGTHNSTYTAQRAMTPEYASPEQVAGTAVTTATDIYSLGVILYELLTGHRPYRLNSRRADEITRIVTTTSPSKPSSRCKSHGLRVAIRNPQATIRDLEGDLDNIVLMAIRKEPERRYSSVEQFAEDIRRYLGGLPVIAQEDTFRYRAAKFVKRNKAGVAAGTGVAVSLIGGLIATSRQARNASRQRDRARRETRKAEKINEFLKKMLASADPRVGGKDVKVLDVLGEAAASIDTDFANQPEIAFDLESTLGLTYLSLGQYEPAERHILASLEKCRKVFPRISVQTAMSLNNYAKLVNAKGDFRSAELLFYESLEILGKVMPEGLEVAEVLSNLGYAVAIRGDSDAALRLHRRELRIKIAKLGPNNAEVAKALEKLGGVLTSIGRCEEAEALLRRSFAILDSLYGPEHPDIALSMINLAGALLDSNAAEAESLCRASLAMRRKLFGEPHVDVVWSIYNLAYLLIEGERFAEAWDMLQEALAQRGANLPDQHPVVASCLLLEGRLLLEAGQPSNARSAFEECLRLRRETLPPDHWLIATTRSFLGECVAELGDPERGAAMMKESYVHLVRRLGASHRQSRQLFARLANRCG